MSRLVRSPIARCSLSPCSTASRVRSLRSPRCALDTVCARRGSATVGDGRTGGLRAPGGIRKRSLRPAHDDVLTPSTKGPGVRSPDVQLQGDCARFLGSGVVGQPTLLRPPDRLQHLPEIGAHLAQSPKRLAESASRRMTSWCLLDCGSNSRSERTSELRSDRRGPRRSEEAM